jgi:hypothetical protein
MPLEVLVDFSRPLKLNSMKFYDRLPKIATTNQPKKPQVPIINYRKEWKPRWVPQEYQIKLRNQAQVFLKTD